MSTPTPDFFLEEPEEEPADPRSTEELRRLVREALAVETVDAMRSRYRAMGHPDDGGAYMVQTNSTRKDQS